MKKKYKQQVSVNATPLKYLPSLLWVNWLGHDLNLWPLTLKTFSVSWIVSLKSLH